MLNPVYARSDVPYCPAVERDKIVMGHEIAAFAQSLITRSTWMLLIFYFVPQEKLIYL